MRGSLSWFFLASVAWSFATACSETDDSTEARGGNRNAGGVSSGGAHSVSGGAVAVGGAAGSPEAGANSSAGNAGAPNHSHAGAGGGESVAAGGAGGSDAGGAGGSGEVVPVWTFDPAACGAFHCGEHGTCLTVATESHCECRPGYAGALCDEDVDECANNPCVAGCTNSIGGFACECPSGLTGPSCQLPVFQGIGVLPGAKSSRADGLSRDGLHVLAESGQQVALFDVATAALTNVSPVQDVRCRPVAVNGDGSQLIGNCYDITRDGVAQNYVWAAGKTAYFEGPLQSADISAMSHDGSVIVGTYHVQAGDEKPIAFRADASGVHDLIETVHFAGGPTPVSVSADGKLVGLVSADKVGYVWSTEFGLRRLAGDVAVYTPQMSILVSGDGSTFTGSGDIWLLPDRGWVYGGTGRRWRGSMVRNTTPGALGVSGDGSVMFGRYTVPSSSVIPVARSYFQRSDGADLYPVLRALAPEEWSSLTVAAISDDGRVVAGNGIRGGISEGWVAQLP